MRELEQFADPEIIPGKVCKEIRFPRRKRGGGRLCTAFLRFGMLRNGKTGTGRRTSIGPETCATRYAYNLSGFT